jgi:hypothetical protein
LNCLIYHIDNEIFDFQLFYLPLALVITILTIIETSSIINFSTPVFATNATVTDQQFTAKLFGDMEVPPIKTNATGWGEALIK